MENKQKYQIFIDDNFHYMDGDYRSPRGGYDTLEEAISICKDIVDGYILSLDYQNSSFDQLWGQYTAFGEDPWISGPVEGIPFSAWDYAKNGLRELAGKLDCQFLTRTLGGVKTHKKIYELKEDEVKNYHKLGEAVGVSLLACIALAGAHVDNFMEVVYGYQKVKSEAGDMCAKATGTDYLTVAFYEKLAE
ncbi:hypothetical protein GYA13_00615 [Candidatus Kuenenbacteria bacterium]|nr:hypothetical protein [Candidatus Kuenenbacteria bacterium]